MKMRYYIAINNNTGPEPSVAIPAPNCNAAHAHLRMWAATLETPKYDWDGFEVEQREIDKLDQAAYFTALNANLSDPAGRPGRLVRRWRMTQRGGLRELDLPTESVRPDEEREPPDDTPRLEDGVDNCNDAGTGEGRYHGRM